jgi:lipopolysaccharide export system permease protein
MRILTRMIFKQLIPVFLLSLLFFVMVILLLDIFSNLWKFLNNQVSLLTIAQVYLLYIPKSISYVLPVTLLFSITYTMGNIYANNELIAILNSGISLFRISLPLLLLGFLISIGSFFFEQYVVIDTYREKNLLTASLTGSSTNYNNSLVTIMTRRGELVYHAVFYNDSQKELSRPLIIERDSDGRLIKRLEADRAVWQEDKWLFYQARIYEKFNNQNGPVLQSYDELEELTYNEPPETFRRDKRNVEEMTLTDSRDWVQSQIKAGLPYKEALTDYYQRYSFPLTSLIVILISCAMGSRFKKNILLMSLLTSLSLSVAYYIMQMLTALMASYGMLSPLSGAWMGFILFLIGGIILFRHAPT